MTKDQAIKYLRNYFKCCYIGAATYADGIVWHQYGINGEPRYHVSDKRLLARAQELKDKGTVA